MLLIDAITEQKLEIFFCLYVSNGNKNVPLSLVIGRINSDQPELIERKCLNFEIWPIFWFIT